MKIVHYTDVEANPLAIEDAEDVEVRLLIGREDGAPNFFMMMLTIKPGGHTPDHSHDWEEEIFVKSGEGTIKTTDDWKPIKEGTVLFVDPNESHQFINNGSEPLELIAMIPRRQ